jgi:hypothetical protein
VGVLDGVEEALSGCLANGEAVFAKPNLEDKLPFPGSK